MYEYDFKKLFDTLKIILFENEPSSWDMVFFNFEDDNDAQLFGFSVTCWFSLVCNKNSNMHYKQHKPLFWDKLVFNFEDDDAELIECMYLLFLI
jgi:hypothetical protein